MRGGSPTFFTPLIESNYFAGLYMYSGTLDSGVGATFYSPYFENNWSAFDIAAAYVVTEYNLFRQTASTFIPFTINNSDTTLTDAGYQIFMGDVDEGTQFGPAARFFNPVFVLGTAVTAQKTLYLKQCFRVIFYFANSASGDQTNSVRLGDTAGGTNFLANIVYFWDWIGTLPASLSNRGMSIIHNTSGNGGWLLSGSFEAEQIIANSRLTLPTITTLADAATPSVIAGNLFKTGGTTPITDFNSGVVGQTIKILAAASITITNGSPILLAGAANYDMTVTDTLTLTMFNDQVWQEVARSVN